jgi:hypothetical protein
MIEMKILNLRHDFEEIDKKIKISIFHAKENPESTIYKTQECHHLGSLVKDGFNISSSGKIQRYRCKNCGKRFGNDVNEWILYEYQFKLKQLIYELFFDVSKQIKMESHWDIPQPKLSQFKHNFVDTVFEQNPHIIISESNELPRGVIYGDETYMGKMGNSNTEVVFCNDNFEILSAGPVYDHDRVGGIIQVFNKIPENCRNKVRIIVSDGEPSYQTLTMINSHKILLLQQYHGHKKLGQVTLHKFQNYGPHMLHYMIHTHWKIFKKGKHELKLKWEIKFIKGKLPIGRGRPTKQLQNSKQYQDWRQKKKEYLIDSAPKEGTAKVFINPNSKRISLRQGSKVWMQKMLQQVLPLFNTKCITNNRVESKHSQIKRTGRLRKQPSLVYSDKLFILQEYILKHKEIPFTILKNRPFYSYLMIHAEELKEGYTCAQNGHKYIQKWIHSYL